MEEGAERGVEEGAERGEEVRGWDDQLLVVTGRQWLPAARWSAGTGVPVATAGESAAADSTLRSESVLRSYRTDWRSEQTTVIVVSSMQNYPTYVRRTTTSTVVYF